LGILFRHRSVLAAAAHSARDGAAHLRAQGSLPPPVSHHRWRRCNDEEDEVEEDDDDDAGAAFDILCVAFPSALPDSRRSGVMTIANLVALSSFC
jgi:hypothetical protein